MTKLEVSDELRIFIQNTCEEYKKEFRKHRKDVSHFSKGGKYLEWESYKYEYRGE
jgi:hypothetical protein